MASLFPHPADYHSHYHCYYEQNDEAGDDRFDHWVVCSRGAMFNKSLVDAASLEGRNCVQMLHLLTEVTFADQSPSRVPQGHARVGALPIRIYGSLAVPWKLQRPIVLVHLIPHVMSPSWAFWTRAGHCQNSGNLRSHSTHWNRAQTMVNMMEKTLIPLFFCGGVGWLTNRGWTALVSQSPGSCRIRWHDTCRLPDLLLPQTGSCGWGWCCPAWRRCVYKKQHQKPPSRPGWGTWGSDPPRRTQARNTSPWLIFCLKREATKGLLRDN